MVLLLTNLPPPADDIKHQEPSTRLFIDGIEKGCGTLYIAESKLSWINNATGEGFSLMYPNISIHAVSRDTQRFGHECLYLIVDKFVDGLETNEEDEENEDQEGETTEMRFVPEDKGQLDAMYQAMTVCQSLHPDPEQQYCSEDDDFVDAYEEGEYNPAGGDSGYVEGINGIERLNVATNGEEDMETEGQFEDAEDEDR